jgi:hypothetical protein
MCLDALDEERENTASLSRVLDAEWTTVARLREALAALDATDE